MKEKMIKYAQVLLKTCLKVDPAQPLFISGNIERIDFMRIVADEAYKIGLKDVNVEIVDPYLKHSALKNLTLEELNETGFLTGGFVAFLPLFEDEAFKSNAGANSSTGSK